MTACLATSTSATTNAEVRARIIAREKLTRPAGLKNLRCFPTCAAQHKERGYCGRSVVLTVHHPKNVHRLCSFADFSESSVAPHYAIGDMVNLASIEEHARTKDQPLYQWVPGEGTIVNASQTQFEYNKVPLRVRCARG